MPAPKGNNYAAGNKGGGRKTSYKPEYAKTAFKFCLLGATDEDLASLFEVTEKTINTWKKEHKEFSTALKEGKQDADAEIAHSLYQNAKGYSHPDLDIKVIDGKIVKTKITRHYPPNTTSAIFWLKNRQPKQFRDKQEVENTLTGQINIYIDDQDAEIGNAK